MKRTRLGAWAISLLVAGSAALAISASLAGPARRGPRASGGRVCVGQDRGAGLSRPAGPGPAEDVHPVLRGWLHPARQAVLDQLDARPGQRDRHLGQEHVQPELRGRALPQLPRAGRLLGQGHGEEPPGPAVQHPDDADLSRCAPGGRGPDAEHLAAHAPASLPYSRPPPGVPARPSYWAQWRMWRYEIGGTGVFPRVERSRNGIAGTAAALIVLAAAAGCSSSSSSSSSTPASPPNSPSAAAPSSAPPSAPPPP